MDARRVAPRGSHHLLRAVCWTVLLVPLAVTSTPPSLPPYHEYTVNGTISRSGGGTLEGFAIVLVYKLRDYEGPSDWVRGDAADLTSATGHFQVRSGQFYGIAPDSLAPAMVSPDTMIVGIPFPTSEDPGFANESLHTHTDDGFFCDDEVSSWEVDGYSHYYDDKVLVLP